MHILSSDNRSEFLACPQLVRLDYARGENGFEPTLLVKGSTLLLKYIVAGVDLQFILARIEDRLLYCLRVQDDQDKPATLWSVVEKEEELKALGQLLKDKGCRVFLFNELALNVAWTETPIALSASKLSALMHDLSLGRVDYSEIRNVANGMLDRLHAGEVDDSIIVHINGCSNWRKVNNVLITNKATRSPIDLFEQDEGRQQEELAIWLTDNLHPNGAYRSPQIPKNQGKRELTDVLLTYENGAFLIESKALALQSRANLPNRSKLSRDIAQHVAKAVSQLRGGIRQIKAGAEVTAQSGEVISIEREQPAHALILVPDLDLLDDEAGYGIANAIDFMKKTGGFLHLLDVVELLRIVQAAEKIASVGKTTTPMMALDYYLIERAKRAIELGTLRFSMLLRME